MQHDDSSATESGINVEPIRVVVLGGGTAGWMTAAALVGLIGSACTVELVESAEIGVVGVGEATLPHLRGFLKTLGIIEAEFMAATHATYKLGIEFRDFANVGDRYVHPFGTFGRPFEGVDFHHYWLRRHHSSPASPVGQKPSFPIGEYCLGVMAAEHRRFAHPQGDADDPTTSYGYAYQFDATRFAPFMRAWAQMRGARRTEGIVTTVERNDVGGVAALVLADGRRTEGDLFIDCSGFRSLLLGETMTEPWEDWSQWLSCDRAVAVASASPDGPIEPFTQATAMPAGWRWRIPLRHRVGNGYVYASRFLDDEGARDALLATLDRPPLAEPRLLRFSAGRRRRSWVGNVVAIGLASGFLEPLESTSIHLVQMAITHLIERFPEPVIEAIDRDGFNAAVDADYDRIRDFLILHYHATTRNDSPFWNHMRTMPIPDTLADRIALWRRSAHVPRYGFGLFLEPSWVAVLLGQNIVPEGWDQRADLPDGAALDRALDTLRRSIHDRVALMPDHAAYLQRATA